MSNPRITALKAQGMPVDSIEAAVAWRNARHNVANDRASGKLPDSKPTQPVKPPSQPPASGQTVEDEMLDFNRSRALREYEQAHLARLTRLEREGELVERAAVVAAMAKQIVVVREALLQIPARLAPTLAHEVDVARIQTAIDREIRNVVAGLVGLST